MSGLQLASFLWGLRWLWLALALITWMLLIGALAAAAVVPWIRVSKDAN